MADSIDNEKYIELLNEIKLLKKEVNLLCCLTKCRNIIESLYSS